MTEAKVQTELLRYFTHEPLDGKTYKVYREIPLMSRIVDIFLQKDNSLISIEVKLKNWKRAIEQLKDHSCVVDKAILIMPKATVPRNTTTIEEKINKFDLSFYIWDQDKKEIEKIVDKKSRMHNEFLRKNFLEIFDDIKLCRQHNEN